jgi:hypothetical protein
VVCWTFSSSCRRSSCVLVLLTSTISPSRPQTPNHQPHPKVWRYRISQRSKISIASLQVLHPPLPQPMLTHQKSQTGVTSTRLAPSSLESGPAPTLPSPPRLPRPHPSPTVNLDLGSPSIDHGNFDAVTSTMSKEHIGRCHLASGYRVTRVILVMFRLMSSSSHICSEPTYLRSSLVGLS